MYESTAYHQTTVIEGYERLAAAILGLAAFDAIEGDADAWEWLRTERAEWWASVLGVTLRLERLTVLQQQHVKGKHLPRRAATFTRATQDKGNTHHAARDTTPAKCNRPLYTDPKWTFTHHAMRERWERIRAGRVVDKEDD